MGVIKSNASYIVKLLINHFVSGIYSLILFCVFTVAFDGQYQLVGSVISILFYLYLVYSFMWDAGAKRAVGSKSSKIKVLDGAIVMAVGSLPYYLSTVLCAFLSLFASSAEFAERTVDVVYRTLFYVNVFFTQCMYSGLLATFFGHVADVPAFVYLLSLIPGLVVGTTAYVLGTKNFRIRTLFGIKYNEEKEKIKNNY